ncbi:MAG: glutamate racemase [Melioribacteraceae bacterium]|nr:MAG: glutamate racemase [Melioribacteraceae bacterium]
MYFMDRSNPIGVFDSGIGGLTVVKRINSFLPNENIVYFGDTARVPYGTKSNETVTEYALQDANFLVKKNVKLIVVACNTVSSVAMDVLRKKYDIPVIGMIKPGALSAVEATKNGKIGVIGTNATINNKAYSTELKKLDKKLSVLEKACPLFVPLAEEGWTDHKATRLIAQEYLLEMREQGVDTLILGCTHYPILADVIQEVMGRSVTLIDSGTAASTIVETHLHGKGLRNISNHLGFDDFYVSDLPGKFREIAERFLGKKVENISKVDIDYITGLK